MPAAPTVKTTSPSLFNWLTERGAGVLLHPTSLPGQFGVGTLDETAVRFLEFLAAAGMKYWQICPLGPTGYGDSPYQCFSAFAGNPYLIDLTELSRSGLIAQEELGPLLFLNSENVDYGSLYRLKWPILFKVFDNFSANRRLLPYGDFESFKKQQASWLGSYAYYRALKDHFKGQPWWDWSSDVRFFHLAEKSALKKKLSRQIEAHEFFQYLFFGQWARLKAKATGLGISIIGDAPIFVARDSADVWANPQLFLLDQTSGIPNRVAGVPPDYFSAEGQLWGNPLYDWPVHAKDGFAWWLSRLETNFALYDVIRIDHFRGFDTYWSIPYGAPTAKEGIWEQGPGMPFFQAVKNHFPAPKLIAEDLGELVDSVVELRDATGLPGMAILQFGFGGKSDNLYLPHNLIKNSVIYPGTHDNDTSLGWYASTDEKSRDHVRRYFRVSGAEVGWDFIRASYESVSRLAIIPMQDLFSLGSSARMNTPGKADGNWQWRFHPGELDRLKRDSAPYLKTLAELYGR